MARGGAALPRAGRDVNAVNEMGLAAVHGAANRGSDDIIELLARRGARLDVADKQGRTPYAWAEGVFLATNSPVAKPSTMALIKRLLERTMNRLLSCTSLTSTSSRPALACSWRSPPSAGRAHRRLRARRGAPPCGISSSNTASPVITRGQTPAVSRSMRSNRRTSTVMPRRGRRSCASFAPGMMPPDGAPKPAPRFAQTFTTALEATLDAAAARRSDPGAPALHRLNRTDTATPSAICWRSTSTSAHCCRQTIRRPASTTSPTCLASLRRSSRATWRRPRRSAAWPSAIRPSVSIAPCIGVPGDLSQDSQLEGLPIGTRGGIVVRHMFPLDAEYDLQVGRPVAARGWAERRRQARGADDLVRGDRRRSHRGAGARRDAHPRVRRGLTPRCRGRGPAIATAGADGVFDIAARAPGITQVAIAGPHNAAGPGDTPSRRRLLVCTPASAADEEPCARRILSTLLTRAYRRPVAATAPELDDASRVLSRRTRQRNLRRGHPAGAGARARRPVLPVPLRTRAAPAAAGAAYRISDLELASRLSFFLWSSIPDDELIAVAAKGALKDPATLEHQVRRMLSDPRADALVANFAGQWLFLRELKNARPDSPDFDGNLRPRCSARPSSCSAPSSGGPQRHRVPRLRLHVRRRAPGAPLRHRRHPRSADAPRHDTGRQSASRVARAWQRADAHVGGEPHVAGRPRQVDSRQPAGNAAAAAAAGSGNEPREGSAAGQGDLVAPAAGAASQQPDVRGVPPPDGSDRPGARKLRPHGTWREMDGPTRIDATGQLADGTKVTGPDSLRRALLARSDVFVSVVAEKLLTYAVGRPMRPRTCLRFGRSCRVPRRSSTDCHH